MKKLSAIVCTIPSSAGNIFRRLLLGLKPICPSIFGATGLGFLSPPSNLSSNYTNI